MSVVQRLNKSTHKKPQTHPGVWSDRALDIYGHVGMFAHMHESACGEQCVWAHACVCYGFLVCGGDGWGLNWHGWHHTHRLVSYSRGSLYRLRR